MPLISEQDREKLKERFAAELTNPVKMIYFTQRESKLFVPGQEKCELCKETQELLEEVASLSEGISLEVHDFAAESELAQSYGVDKIPATILNGNGDLNIRFFGIPSGYEFSTLIEDIADVSQHQIHLSEKTQKALAEIEEEVHIQVFVTPT